MAFPGLALEYANKRGINPFVATEKGQLTGFNAASQHVDVTGAHAFIAPGPNDQRGPCPGLNALANHGFLPHNGVGTIQQFIDATNTVYGMGVELSTALSIYGATIVGDGMSWSVGGPSSSLSTIGLLSQPQGISFSHNKFETDGSPTRGDLYLSSDDYSLHMSQFNALYATQDGIADSQVNYNVDVLNAFRDARITQSKASNPYYFSTPFSGFIVQPAAYLFIYRLMANKSAEYPEGRLDRATLKSFFAISGEEEGNFKWTPGYERIPDNWYKRTTGDEYTFAAISLDVNQGAARYPQFNEVGGNTGTPNSFASLEAASLTGGVLNAQNIAKDNNLVCYGLQGAIDGAPDLLRGQVANVIGTVNMISKAFAPASAILNCPQLTTYNSSLFSQYPGYVRLSVSGSYST